MDTNFPPLKRHHSQPPPPPQPPASSPREIIFRILCPKALTGRVIGKGGAVIRKLRDETGAKIRVIDEFPSNHSDERVIVISSTDCMISVNSNLNSANYGGLSGKVGHIGEGVETLKIVDEVSMAQTVLLKVFERILKVDEEREMENGSGDNEGGALKVLEGHVVCRLLAPSYQVGCVLGRGGKIVEKLRAETGAQIRVLPRECIPSCASPGDELIQMTGNFQAVREALLSVSSCLQDSHRGDAFQGASGALHMDSNSPRGRASAHLAADFHSRGFPHAPEVVAPNKRMPPEDDVTFKILCPADKVGSLIGKGGCIIRVIENETGASIKVTDTVAPDSEERVVLISARESWEFKRSPAQDAVLRVHCRIAELGYEPGAAVIARLLVHSQQIGCLLGKGGNIIAEMRRLTGASIRVFGREQGPKGGQNEEVVQVIGNLHAVKDALFQITRRLRETIFPLQSSPYNVNVLPNLPFSELPSPSFRLRHDPISPGYYPSPIGLAHGNANRSPGKPQGHQSVFSQNTNRLGSASNDQLHYNYGSDRPSYGPVFDGPGSPRSWHPQTVSCANPSRFSGVGAGMLARNGDSDIVQTSMTPSVEVAVPRILLSYVYGENSGNLTQIRQLSGADVAIHDPMPGAAEGSVILSGTPKQLHLAQSLVHAFILSEQSF